MKRVSLICLFLGWLIPINNVLGFQQLTQSETKETEKQTESSSDNEKRNREPIYDENANGEELIIKALAKAKKENRRVLIQWGANWCTWCYLLHDLMRENPEIRRKIQYEYDVVQIDVGSLDKNTELFEKYEADLKQNGLPFLTILDAEGKVIVHQETSSLESKEEGKQEHVPELVLEFLSKHQAEPLNATTLLEKALALAEGENKLVFVHFGAPWCGWCHHLENWLAQDDVSEILGKHFVDIKIDQDRMTDAKSLFERYCKEPGGIPWFICLDPADGSVTATSGEGDKNIGFPSTDEEIQGFADFLSATERFNETEIEKLKASLVENRKRREAAAAASKAK